MSILLIILYVLVCLFLIMVVLLQQGKGADLAGAFGGGGSQTSFGPRTTTNIMHRMTTGAFVLFVVLCLALAILSGKQRSSVMENIAAPEAQTAPVEPAMEPAADEPAPGADETLPVGDETVPPAETESSDGAAPPPSGGTEGQ